MHFYMYYLKPDYDFTKDWRDSPQKTTNNLMNIQLNLGVKKAGAIGT